MLWVALQLKRGSGLKRDTALAAAAAYQSMYCDDGAGDSIAATYQVSARVQWLGRLKHSLSQHFVTHSL